MLVRPDLTPEMIERGGQLIRQIERARVIVKAAFWYLDVEAAAWRLILASPEVRTVGPAAIYRKVRKALGFLSLDTSASIPFDRISVVDTHHPIVQALAGPFKTKGDDLVGATISNVTVDGVYLSEVYLYKQQVTREERDFKSRDHVASA